ncbi:MAG: penicillin-binding protein 1C [Chthoniobacterales bacterium]
MKIRLRWKLVALATVACVAVWLMLPRPPLLDGISFSTVVRDRDGHILRIVPAGDGMVRVFTPLEQISPRIVQATLFYEDRHFDEHPGVNPVALARAAWRWISGPARGGASTITMQVARLRGGLHTRSFFGKCAQIFEAICIERHYTKRQILEAYFNLAPYGGNIEGVGAASWIYLGRAPGALSWPEAAALSVIPQSPAHRKPQPDCDNVALNTAQKRLHAEMLRARMVDDALGGSFALRSAGGLSVQAPQFVNGILREATGGEIRTTLDGFAQELVECSITRYVEARSSVGVHNAAAMLLDTRTMEVLADVGSADFWNAKIDGQVDGTRSPRSPGSALKPFIYALALDQGLIHPQSLLIDAPGRFGDYSPDNFDREFCGPLSAAAALARSRNVPAVELASRLRPGFYDFLRDAGVAMRADENSYGLSLALGGAEVTMEDLVRLYAMLANGGALKPLVKTGDGSAPAARRMLSAEAAFLTLDMLSKIPAPGATETDPSRVVCWKTGTSHAFRDAWSVAAFDHYVLAVWVGNFDGSGNPEFVGRTCAGPLLFQIIDRLADSGVATLRPLAPPASANLKRVEFCAMSGELPGEYCAHRTTGWFIPGVSPITVCDVHRQVLVDARSGLRVMHDDGNCRREVFEFWPSNVMRLFEQAGVPRRTPPPFSPDCAVEMLARKGAAPRIVSPSTGASFAIRPGADGSRVPLAAQADADVRKVHWFADSEYLGSAAPGQPLAWSARPGKWRILALDDQGRSAERVVTVLASAR